MIKEGLLDKYGKPNENTPENWKQSLYSDVWVNIEMFNCIYVHLECIYLLCCRIDNIKMKTENEEEEPVTKKVRLNIEII